MPDQLADLRRQVEDREQEQLTAWQRHSGVTEGARDAYRGFSAAAAKAKQAARSAESRVKQLRDDDLMPLAGKRRLMDEALSEARRRVGEEQARMDVALKILEAELSMAAMPRLDRTREQTAKDEVLIRLGSANVSETIAVLSEFARGEDDLAAVVCTGTWTESLLRGRGVAARDVGQFVSAIRETAAQSAAQSADPKRAAVAAARADLALLGGAQACTVSITRTALESAEETAQGVPSDGSVSAAS